MKMHCKPIIISADRQASCIPASLWNDLFASSTPVRMFAGQARDAAIAFIVQGNRSPHRLALLQTVRASYNARGVPVGLGLNTVRITPSCELVPGAAPRPAPDKLANSAHFWHPSPAELASIALALTVALNTPPPSRIDASHRATPFAPPFVPAPGKLVPTIQTRF